MPNDKDIQDHEFVLSLSTGRCLHCDMYRYNPCHQYQNNWQNKWAEVVESGFANVQVMLKEALAEVERLTDHKCFEITHTEDGDELLLGPLTRYDVLDLCDKSMDLRKRAETAEAELAQLKQQSVDLRTALAFIAYGKQHTGVIPCPQDHDFYIKPFRDRAREALDALNIPKDNEETD